MLIRKKMKNVIFQKYQGAGNDFIVIDLISKSYSQSILNLTPDNIKSLCTRNYGIGADGIILALPSLSLDLKMVIYNSDGTEAEMCGNGIRCLIKFVIENKLVDNKPKLFVETKAGTIIAKVSKDMDIEVNMGCPSFIPKEIPTNLLLNNSGIPHTLLSIYEHQYNVYSVGMGNPHAVIYVDELKEVKLNKWGRYIENIHYFPERTNVHFVQVISHSELNVLVWERGSGATLACGTGACACVAVSNLLNRCNSDVLVNLPGGQLKIRWPSNQGDIFMSGPSRYVYSGKCIIS